MPNKDGTGPTGNFRRGQRGGCQGQRGDRSSTTTNGNQASPKGSWISQNRLSSEQAITAFSLMTTLVGSLIALIKKNRQPLISREEKRQVIDVTPPRESKDRFIESDETIK